MLEGKQRVAHPWLFWENVGTKAVRQGKWKLVGYGDPAAAKNWELYDLEEDRTEVTNLAQQHPDRVSQMAKAWRAWAERTGTRR